ncbi:MAG: glycosyltransferase family 39 protein [bacterium]
MFPRSATGRWLQSPAVLPLGLTLVLLAAAGLRLWQLGGKSLWFDEAYSLFIAQQPILEVLRLVRTHDTHPPLYYLMLHGWMALAGRSEVAVRFPSVAIGVATALLTFQLARRLAGDRVGILAAALMAFSPFHIASSQEARMYPLLTAFGLGASYALWLALEEGRRRHWIAYVGLMLLALGSHHLAFLLLAAHGLYVILVHRNGVARRAWLGWTTVALIVYLPLLLPLLMDQLIAVGSGPNVRPPFGLRAVADTLSMFSFGGNLFGTGSYFRRGVLPLAQHPAVVLPFLLLACAGVAGVAGWRRRAYLLTCWLFPVVAAAAISLKWNIFYERYFVFALPPFLILVAAGIVHLAEGMGRVRWAVSPTLLALVASFYLPALADLYRATEFYDWRGAAAYVSRNANPDDVLLFIPAFGRIPFDYYFRGAQARRSLNPQRMLVSSDQVHPTGEGSTEVLADLARRHPRMWIIATLPVGYENRLRINRVLSPYFRELEGRDFNAVYAFLWESRRWKPPDGR